MQDYVFKTEPFDHQRKSFLEYRDREFHGHLWEQGLGKSKVIIDTVAWLYSQGKIKQLVVVAPNGVHRNWILNEIPEHMPDYIDYQAAWYASSMKKAEEKQLLSALKHDGLTVVTINIDAIITEKGKKFLKNVLISKDSMFVIDESTDIKNIKTQRTEVCLDFAVHAKYRRILTGTPITKGPLDYFSQLTFLSPEILGNANYYGFRNRYAIMKNMVTTVNGQTMAVDNPRYMSNRKDRRFQIVDSYKNLPELVELVAPYIDRLVKVDCLDLPDKLFQKRYVLLTGKQKQLYTKFKKELVIEMQGLTMSAPLLLTKMMRLQQIVGGYFQPDIEVEFDDNMEPIFSAKKPPVEINNVNPRIEALIDIANSTEEKMVVWCKYRHEIAAVCKRLRNEYGDTSVVEYHGGIKDDDRSDAIAVFQGKRPIIVNGRRTHFETIPVDKQARFFVGNVQAGGKGITLHAASVMVYYSNDFSLENRLQSEDRVHRIGQTKNVTYIDMVAPDTIDEHVVEALRNKKNVADLLTGDTKLESWL